MLRVQDLPFESLDVGTGESEEVKLLDFDCNEDFGSNPDTKISLTNAPKQTMLKRLAWMQRRTGIGSSAHLRMRRANAAWLITR